MRSEKFYQWFVNLGELIRPKTETEKRIRATYSIIIIFIAAVILIYRLS